MSSDRVSPRSLLWPALATMIALAILLGLGLWQLQRREQKTAILSALERGASTEPLALDGPTLRSLAVQPAGRSPSAHALPELTRVRLTGVYLDGPSLPIRATLPMTKGALTSGIGFFWMTPLRLADGTLVFVNRGFGPSGADFKPLPIRTPDGPQTVVGLLRAPERRQLFTPADDPARGEYFVRDPEVMASVLKLDPTTVATLFVDAERRSVDDPTPPVGVEAREMISRIPNNHLQYAVTWFGLALTLVGVFAAFAASRLRGSS